MASGMEFKTKLKNAAVEDKYNSDDNSLKIKRLGIIL